MRLFLKTLAKTIIVFLSMASTLLAGAQTIQTLCSFNGANGASPQAALVLGADGNFYSTTDYGGSSG